MKLLIINDGAERDIGMRKTYWSHSLTTSKILLAISKAIQVRLFDRGLGNRGNVCFTTISNTTGVLTNSSVGRCGGTVGLVNLSHGEELG